VLNTLALILIYASVLSLIAVYVIGAVLTLVMLLQEKPWREVVHPDRLFWHRGIGVVISVFLITTLWFVMLSIGFLSRHPRTRHWFS